VFEAAPEKLNQDVIKRSPAPIYTDYDAPFAKTMSQLTVETQSEENSKPYSRGERGENRIKNRNNCQQPKRHIPINDLFFSSLVLLCSAPRPLRLMKQLAIRLSGQTTPAKSLVIRVKSLFHVNSNYQQPTRQSLCKTPAKASLLNCKPWFSKKLSSADYMD